MSGGVEKTERLSRIFASGFIEIIGHPVICIKTFDLPPLVVQRTISDLSAVYILATTWFPTLQRFSLEVRHPNDNSLIWVACTQFRLNEQFRLTQNLCGTLKRKKEPGNGSFGQ